MYKVWAFLLCFGGLHKGVVRSSKSLPICYIFIMKGMMGDANTFLLNYLGFQKKHKA